MDFSFGNFLHDWLTWEGGPTMPLFGVWHIVFDIIIFGNAFALGILLRNKSDHTKRMVLSGLAIALVSLYLFDFFMGPLFRSMESTIDKLPFHICTFLCPVIIITRFIMREKANAVKPAIAVLALVSSMMYMTYPGSAIGDDSYAFSYVVLQTFLYHGVLFTFGFLSIALGEVKVELKKFWIIPICIAVIVVWAELGNFTFNYVRDYNWFFLRSGIGIPGIPEPLWPVLIFVAITLMSLIIVGLTYAVDAIRKKIEAK